jgi:glycosyltransferase involved in cell wall biosynthesis
VTDLEILNQQRSRRNVEIVQTSESAVSHRPRIRVALNAIKATFGARVYLWELASAIAKTDGVDLVLLVGKEDVDDIPPLLLSKVRKISISSKRSYLQTFRQRQIRELLVREKIDLYHIPNTMPLLRRAMPTVVTIHDMVELRVRKYGVLRTAYRYFANSMAAHLADQILTVSEHSKRDVVRFLHVPESKVAVVYNGISEDFHQLDRKECKDYLASKYSIAGDFLLAPGGLSRNKNIPGLLAAMRLLKERGRLEFLVLLGNKADREFKYVVAELQRSGLGRTVVLPGFVARKDLPAFYSAASVVVYPTLYEGFGFPVLEAMACGTPVVTSSVSSLPEVAGDAAVLVDPKSPEDIANGVQRVLTDEALRAELSSRGLLRVRRFTWERAAKETIEVFFEVLARRQSK